MLRRALVVLCAAVALVVPAAPAFADDVYLGDCYDPEWSVTVDTRTGTRVHACGDYPP